MVICELCGSANNEMDESCRVCGQALTAQAPVAAGSAWPPGPPEWPSPPPQSGPSAELQMSAVKQAPQTGVPPMMSGRQELEPVMSEPVTSSVPGFMNSARATGPAQEPVQLISANDLPDWIKQIAAEDEAKAQNEAKALAEAAADPTDPSATIVRRQLPGETHVGGPSTTWLSKSAAPVESTEHWGASDVASANWGAIGASGGDTQVTYEEGVVSAPVFIPSTADAHTYARPEKKLSLPDRSKGAAQPSTRPVYRRQSVQLLALLVVLAVLALMML